LSKRAKPKIIISPKAAAAQHRIPRCESGTALFPGWRSRRWKRNTKKTA
jgi:hypothetical protein